MRERQRDYELMFIISPLRSSEEDVAATISRIQQGLAGIRGEVTSVEQAAPWGRRKLAYPIRRYSEGEASRRSFNEGFYVLMRFNLPTTQIDEFDRLLKLNESVIRHLITIVDHRGQSAIGDGSAIAIESRIPEIEDGDDDMDV